MSLRELIVKSAISIQLDATDKADVIQTLGNKLLEAGFVKETFVEAALTREKSMPTGLPLSGSFNAAIPHTDVEHVKKSGVAVATLKNPVTFQNMVNPDEAVEVRVVFLLALDKPKAQIEMLQEIAGVLQNPTLIEKFMTAQVPQDIIQALNSENE